MKFFDAGQEAHGFIAIGQVATGFFALGQGATGVIAIGQLARGVIAIGQVAIGVVTICQVGFGLAGCAAMLGIAGRWSKGLVFPLFPPSKPTTDGPPLPPTTPLEAIRTGRAQNGWIEANLEPHGAGVAVLRDGRPVDVEVDEGIAAAARRRAEGDWTASLLRVHREERIEADAQRGYREAAPSEWVLVADRIREIPEPKWRQTSYWVKLGGKALVLLILLGVYTVVGANAILEGLLTIPR